MTAALNEFQHMLSTEQRTQLASFSSSPPTPEDVVQFTTQITKANQNRKSSIYAARVQGLLYSVQQYSSIIDTCVSSNQIAALVWGGVKLVILVSVSTLAQFSGKILIND